MRVTPLRRLYVILLRGGPALERANAFYKRYGVRVRFDAVSSIHD